MLMLSLQEFCHYKVSTIVSIKTLARIKVRKHILHLKNILSIAVLIMKFTNLEQRHYIYPRKVHSLISVAPNRAEPSSVEV